jgi:hypothetical protein
MPDETLAAVAMRLGAVETKLDVLTEGQLALRGQVAELDNQMRVLDSQMRVLHEDTISNIKALAPDLAPIRREFQEADANLREDVNRRLSPLEAIARSRRGE